MSVTAEPAPLPRKRARPRAPVMHTGTSTPLLRQLLQLVQELLGEVVDPTLLSGRRV